MEPMSWYQVFTLVGTMIGTMVGAAWTIIASNKALRKEAREDNREMDKKWFILFDRFHILDKDFQKFGLIRHREEKQKKKTNEAQ